MSPVFVCGKPGDLTTEPSIPRPRFTLYRSLSTTECNSIQSGIDHLIDSDDEECPYAGNMLQLLFDSDYAGFQPGDPNIATSGMYVPYQVDPSSPSGERRFGNDIYVSSVSSNAPSVGGLLAHEFEHYEGRDNHIHQYTANARQAACQL